MKQTFVRVYVLKDGTKYVAGAYYPTEELAAADIDLYNPVPTENGYAPDLSNVSYATVERRFSPFPAEDMGWITDVAV